MDYLSKAASHPRVIGGFAAVISVGAFLGALALAGPSNDESFESAQATSVEQPALDPAGLALAMSLETEPEQVALAAPQIAVPKTVSPACSWESDGVAELCQSDWPYSDAQFVKSNATPCYDDFGDVMECKNDPPRQETQVARSATAKTGTITYGEEIDDSDSLESLDD
jgi:hypothetical protein